MEARCTCTMQLIGNRWLKPEGGYNPPDPNCDKCKGRGFLTVNFDKETFYSAVCPACGQGNGGCVVNDKFPARHICVTPGCENECDWVGIEEGKA